MWLSINHLLIDSDDCWRCLKDTHPVWMSRCQVRDEGKEDEPRQ